MMERGKPEDGGRAMYTFVGYFLLLLRLSQVVSTRVGVVPVGPTEGCA